MQSIHSDNLPTSFGKFHILEKIKENNQISYYRARTLGVAGFEKILLLVVPSVELSLEATFVDFLLKETRKTVTLAHANIAQVYDLGKDEKTGQYYVAMEYVGGHSLQEILAITQKSGKSLPPDLAILIATEIAKGLDYVHRRKSFEFENLNIVHGDIRPSNIFISFDGSVKISNFGIAYAYAANALAHGHHDIASIKYFAPEVIKSRALTQSGDIFSLGLVFYEMLVGRSPYNETNSETAYEFISRGAIPPLAKRGIFPREIVRIIESMLVPNPNGRVESAGVVFEELVGYMYVESIKVDPRLLTKFLAEIGLSRHRNAPPPSDSDNRFTAFSLRRHKSVPPQTSIYVNVSFDPESNELPSWLVQPLLELEESSDTFELEYQNVLLIDEPELNVEYATDRWAHLIANPVHPNAPSCRDIVLIQTLFNKQSLVNPATDMLEQLIYPLTEIINEHSKIFDGPVRGFERRQFALEVLCAHGLESRTCELLREIWILGSPLGASDSVARNPRALARAISEAILFAVDTTCKVANKRAFVWFASGIELIDALSIMVMARLSRAALSYPIFTIMSTSDEALVAQTMSRDRIVPERLHVITVNYTVKEGSLPLFEALDQQSRELLLLLTIWGNPISLDELIELTGKSEALLLQLTSNLKDARWIREILGRRYAVRQPEALTDIFEYYTSSEISNVAKALRDFYAESIFHPRYAPLECFLDCSFATKGYPLYSQDREKNNRIQIPAQWQPIDIIWARLHAFAGEPAEMIMAAEYVVRSLDKSGLFGTLSCYFNQLDEIIVDSEINVPHYRNGCLIRNSRLKIYMLDLDTAQQQIYFLSTQSDQCEGDQAIANVLLAHGAISFMNDKNDYALSLFKQAADIASIQHNPRILALAHLYSAITHLRVGNHSTAARLQRAAEDLYHYYGEDYFSPGIISHILAYGVYIQHIHGALPFAVDSLAELEVVAHYTQDPIAACYLLLGRGIHAFALGEFDVAYQTLRDCASYSSSYRFRFNTVLSVFILVHISFIRGDYKKAHDYLGRASLITSRAPESVISIFDVDFRILIDLVDPEVDVDEARLSTYFNSGLVRAKKLSISSDLERLRFIASYAPAELVPPELLELPVRPYKTPLEQLQLFAL